MNWKLVWRDHTFTEDDIIGADMFAAQMLSGGGWQAVDPTTGPVEAANLVAVLVARKTSRPVQEVCVEISAAPASDVVGIVQPVG